MADQVKTTVSNPSAQKQAQQIPPSESKAAGQKAAEPEPAPAVSSVTKA
jgi:hypothetical protein